MIGQIDGSPVLVLAQSAVPLSLTGTTSETVLTAFNVPGGLIGFNGAIRVTPLPIRAMMCTGLDWVIWEEGDVIPTDAADAEAKLPAAVKTRLAAERAKG